jgi:TatD DNase family protein
MLIDTHTHIYLDHFQEDIEDVIRRALDKGVEKMLMPAIDSSHFESVKQLEAKFPELLYPMMAVHPGSISFNFRDELRLVEVELQKGGYCAVGETGIDLYWDKTYRQQQMEAFEIQLELAIKFDLPVVIHQRQSFSEIFEILEQPKFNGLAGVFHCFAGDTETAKRCIDLGFLLGIGGVVTYKKSLMADVVSNIPLGYFVLETDAPYLPPVPFRGKRNEPSYLHYVAGKIAELHQVSADEVAERTTFNARKLFRLE